MRSNQCRILILKDKRNNNSGYLFFVLERFHPSTVAWAGQGPNPGKRFQGATLAKASYGTHEIGPARMPNQLDL